MPDKSLSECGGLKGNSFPSETQDICLHRYYAKSIVCWVVCQGPSDGGEERGAQKHLSSRLHSALLALVLLMHSSFLLKKYRVSHFSTRNVNLLHLPQLSKSGNFGFVPLFQPISFLELSQLLRRNTQLLGILRQFILVVLCLCVDEMAITMGLSAFWQKKKMKQNKKTCSPFPPHVLHKRQENLQ